MYSLDPLNILIVSQILLDEVMQCPLVNKILVSKALKQIYTSGSPLGENGGTHTQQPQDQCPRMPNYSLKLEWKITNEKIVLRNKGDKLQLRYLIGTLTNQEILKSSPLKNGIYSFSISCFLSTVSIVILQSYSLGTRTLCKFPLPQSCLITINVHSENVFLKVANAELDQLKVKSTITLTDVTSPEIEITHLSTLHANRNVPCYFDVSPAHTFKNQNLLNL